MQEIEKYMQEHYQCSIAPFYQTWCVILYHYMNQDPKENKEELQRATEYRKNNMENFEFYYEPIIQSLTTYPIYLKETGEKIKQYEEILFSSQTLEQSMNQFIMEQKTELKKYIEKEGLDDVAREWEEQIQTINIEIYKEVVLNWKKSDEKGYEEVLQSQQKKEVQKQELEYQKTFLIDPSLESFSIKELENLKNQQLTYFMQRRKQLEDEALESSSNKQM